MSSLLLRSDQRYQQSYSSRRAVRAASFSSSASVRTRISLRSPPYHDLPT